ncbi:MAG: tRNA lysidine(34) synthetase TilS, partial [Chitinophagaceae bacterium]
MSLLERVAQFIEQQHLISKKDSLVLAISGGADSVVLSHLMKTGGYPIMLAHANFQLRGLESDQDELYVQELAQTWGVPILIKRFNTAQYAEQKKISIQLAARTLRYDWFEHIRHEHGFSAIATAHHAQDNLETLLINFFRGTGIGGLHGIAPKQGKIIRPLLFASRE